MQLLSMLKHPLATGECLQEGDPGDGALGQRICKHVPGVNAMYLADTASIEMFS